MTDTELQVLSREAAGCLPKDQAFMLIFWGLCKGHFNGVRSLWLHESTEACTEIMVRVLWPADQTIHGYKSVDCYTVRAIIDPSAEDGEPLHVEASYAYERDCMLAFRVAVLRALIALKSQ